MAYAVQEVMSNSYKPSASSLGATLVPTEVQGRQNPAHGSPHARPRGRGILAIPNYSMATVAKFVGCSLGISEWVTVDQNRINHFATCTGDRQWIHVDVERAERESPFGGPIAHGYLTLALVGALVTELGIIPPDTAAGLNYGLDKVRFIAPVKSGARVRLEARLIFAEPQSNDRKLLKLQCTLEIEGESKPALVAEMLCMLVAKSDTF
jgi:acyl dehydratase